jgi:hypothetical protein
VLGSTFGEAVIPVCIGLIMHFVSPAGMNTSVLVSVLLLIGIYGTADWMMKAHAGLPATCDAAPVVAVTDTAMDIPTPESASSRDRDNAETGHVSALHGPLQQQDDL